MMGFLDGAEKIDQLREMVGLMSDRDKLLAAIFRAGFRVELTDGEIVLARREPGDVAESSEPDRAAGSEDSADSAEARPPFSPLTPLRAIVGPDGRLRPRVQLRFRSSGIPGQEVALETDDAPCALLVLPPPSGLKGNYRVAVAGTPEQAWFMVQSVMRYARHSGILDLARSGAFGKDQVPHPRLSGP